MEEADFPACFETFRWCEPIVLVLDWDFLIDRFHVCPIMACTRFGRGEGVKVGGARGAAIFANGE
jgi:hypothetical protein